ncbi:unnamed protein product [Anisakis simplex]|uniref:Copper transport protein n=1 Tax=Anisakis simplex TaxID=6269 RepID=A0A3P6Q587_ANISI|nr:unnamed protein product [Anisakis simplex]
MQIILSYVLMLVFMTFSIWLGIAVTLGVAFGYYIFGYRSPAAKQIREKTSTQLP